MSTSKLLTALIAVTFAAPIGFADSASAKKKVTYDQLGRSARPRWIRPGVPGTGLQANERYIRGANCMKSYGYKI